MLSLRTTLTCAIAGAIAVSAATAAEAQPSPPASGSEKPAGGPPAPKPKQRPWRVAEAGELPEWFHFEAQHRSRGEYVVNQFRADRPGDGGLLSFRTSVFAELRPDIVRVGVELMDARAYFANDAIGLNTTHSNPIELLQAYAGLVANDLVTAEDQLTVRVGRVTIDSGSRRLMARNRFRNTLNAFTGIDVAYRGHDGLNLRAFATMPIQRLPAERDDLEVNRVVFDRESFDALHGGLTFGAAPLSAAEVVFEGYAFGTYEQDSDTRRSRNRRLLTPGVRVYRKAKRGEFDFEFESAVQVGVSRASAAADDVTDLDHLALFQHAAIGYSPAIVGNPRFVLQYDYASGDDDRGDSRNGRFDTLFGARRFEFGPTGIYGAFARSNLQTPGMRLELKPHTIVKGFVGYRAFWLDEAADGWTTSGVRAGEDSNATFVGHQLEARVRVDVLPGNLRIEPGVAHLFSGTFLDDAANANPASDTTMLYLQVAGKL